jgi:endonuclease/exonuclease/phosphatase family metal-dependent hydrolase
MRSLTVVTYNIQHGRGMDQHLDLRRTARVLQELSPDIVALQEVDCFRRSSRFRCQARFLARSLGCYYAYGPVNHYFPGSYGNAVLSRYPIRWKRNHVIQDDEKRCCLEVEINSGESCWRVLNLHLGLKAPQRYQQVQDIVIPLCGAVSGPLILAGDFNSIPTSRVISWFPPACKTVLRQ